MALFFLSYAQWVDLFAAQDWMTATPDLVFNKHQYWRAWTTLFAHGDMEHLLSNSLLFIPLTYLLISFYGFWLFPLFGIFIGGLTNFIVLKTLPDFTTLLGISGVISWMGAIWLMLYILIDRRKKWRYRFSIALFLTLMLFIPEKYTPNVSYLSHFIGYVLGLISGLLFYLIKKEKFLKAEVTLYQHEEDSPEDRNFLDSNLFFR